MMFRWFLVKQYSNVYKLVGMDEIDNGTKTVAEATNDYGRKEFIKSHILIMGKSIR